MTSQKLLRTLTGLVLCLGIASQAQAQPDSIDLLIDVNGQTSDGLIVLDPGTYTANVFLRENVGGGTPYIGGGGSGLSTIGFNFGFSGSATGVADTASSPFFLDNSTDSEINGFTIGPPGSGTSGSTDTPAGSFQFNFAGPAAQINFSDLNDGDNTSAFNSDNTGTNVLDGLISFNSASIVTTAIPEPSSFALLGIAGAILTVRRRSRACQR